MSAILSLPTELIAAILSFLSPFTLRELFKIHKRRLYDIVKAAYEPHRWYVENALRHTTSRFKLPPSPQADERKPSRVLPGHNVALHAGLPPLIHTERVPRAMLAGIGLDERCDGFISANPQFLRGWMNLNGSLDWLPPPCNPTGPRDSANHFYKRIERQAHRLGLTLPPAYEALYTTDNVMLPLLEQGDPFCLSQLPPRQIVRCPRSVDGLQDDGYIVPIFKPGQHYFVSLYLERAGWSCVMISIVRPIGSEADLGILSLDFKPPARWSGRRPSSDSSPSPERAPSPDRERATRPRAQTQRERRYREREARLADVAARQAHRANADRPLAARSNIARDIREPDQYFETVRRLGRLQICDEVEVDAAAREGVQVGLNLLFQGPVTIVGLTFEEFLVSWYFENQLTAYCSHLNRNPSRELKEYVAHRYMPLYYNTAMKGKSQFLASFGTEYM